MKQNEKEYQVWRNTDITTDIIDSKQGGTLTKPNVLNIESIASPFTLVSSMSRAFSFPAIFPVPEIVVCACAVIM